MIAAEAELHPIKTNVNLLVAQQVGSNFPNPTPGSLRLWANLTILSITKKEVVHPSGMNPGPNLNSATDSLKRVTLLSPLPPLS